MTYLAVFLFWAISIFVCVWSARHIKSSIAIAVFLGVLFTAAAAVTYAYIAISGDRNWWRIVPVSVVLALAFLYLLVIILSNFTSPMLTPNMIEATSTFTDQAENVSTSTPETQSETPDWVEACETTPASSMASCYSNVPVTVVDTNTKDAFGFEILYLESVNYPDGDDATYRDAPPELEGLSSTTVFDDEGNQWSLAQI